MHAEAERLIEASFGEVLLRTIGRCYSLQAELYLGNFVQAGLAHLRERGCAPSRPSLQCASAPWTIIFKLTLQ